MNEWEILGIEPTNDLKMVKRAYAAKLKTTHPQDKPAEFQELKEAFDNISKRLKNQKEESFDLREVDFIVKNEENNFENRYVNLATATEWQNSSIIYFQSELTKLYDSLDSRYASQKWQAFFQEIETWNMEQILMAHQSAEVFVAQYFMVLPKAVSMFLIETFQISFHLNDDTDAGADIFDLPDFNFYAYEGLTSEQLEAFYQLRYNAYLYLVHEDVNNAEYFLNQAEEIYEKDSDLLTLRALISIRRDLGLLTVNYQSFLVSSEILKKALALDPKNDTARFYYILLSARATKKITSAAENFVAQTDGGYGVHITLLKGYIYFFANKYKEAISEWEQLSDGWKKTVHDERKKAYSHLFYASNDEKEKEILRKNLKEVKRENKIYRNVTWIGWTITIIFILKLLIEYGENLN
ncbi:hypothetical protein [Listeria kieliensis]|uniref:J domain-containing protein n=1 Tax=Listeria kieliensis TaxID=1621700 RepID=A0A3D8TPY9_9LIST|nr:hypothetical protein [Listeria kieliensis]RDX00958.1 hypothetical protein UR08_08320 [Listeria kieliensis]